MSRMAGVGSMISSCGDAGDRRAEDDPRAVAAGLGGLQADRFQAAPDLRDVFDANPVQLDVLPVGDVGGVAGELDRDLADHPQLLGGQCAAVDADAQHEVLVVELPRLERGGLAAVDAGAALGVEPVPAEATAEVTGIDGGESALGVDVLDACPDVERVVVLLRLLVRVERLAISQRPLSFALLAARIGRLRSRGRSGTARARRPGGNIGGHGILVLKKQHEPVWQGRREVARLMLRASGIRQRSGDTSSTSSG